MVHPESAPNPEEPMERTFWQKLEGTTETVLAQLRKLVDEGNIRRVVVKQHGKTIAEFPLTAGVIGAVIAPVAAAIGALSALIADCSIEVEKTVPEPEATPVP
jgi:Domain of unknown function (DUF4342)